MSEKEANQLEYYMPELFAREPKPHLIGGRCKSCGKYTFPKYLACPYCFSDDLEDAPLSFTGILHSYTVVRRSMPDYPVPYGLGLVDFPEGVRVMAQLEADNFDELKLGSQIEITIGRVRVGKNGNDILSYKFRPVR